MACVALAGPVGAMQIKQFHKHATRRFRCTRLGNFGSVIDDLIVNLPAAAARTGGSSPPGGHNAYITSRRMLAHQIATEPCGGGNAAYPPGSGRALARVSQPVLQPFA